MKVLHILNELLPSGAERMLFSSAGYWESDLEIHILATACSEGVYADQLRSVGYIVHHIHKDSYLKQHREVTYFIRKEKFDVVHIHCQRAAFSYALDARKAGVKKLIRTVHNVFVFHGMVQCREFLTRQLACMVGTKHVAVGQSVKDNERNRFCIECTMISNWYDDRKFCYVDENKKIQVRKSLKIEADIYCIVSVGNCTPVKNHMSILKAIANNKEFMEEHNVLYIHIGSGMQEEEEKKYTIDRGIDDMVRFIGFSDPVEYLKIADLFVMPSAYEGFGISGIEGAATGCKILFTDIPGLRDFKKLKLENIRYCKLDDKIIENAIVEEVKKGRCKNSKKQADKIKEEFGIARGVMEYERLYRNEIMEEI